MTKKIKSLWIGAALTIMAGASFSLDLSGDARITRELTAAAVADEIRNQCSSLRGNMIVGMSKAMSLKSYAHGLGATDEQIDAFLNDSAERNRIKQMRNRYLADNGVVSGDEDSYCALGKSEIARDTLIGSLLY